MEVKMFGQIKYKTRNTYKRMTSGKSDRRQMTKSDPIRSDYETTHPIRSDPKSIFLFRSPNESDRIGLDLHTSNVHQLNPVLPDHEQSS